MSIRYFLALLLAMLLLGLYIGHIVTDGTKAPEDTIQLQTSTSADPFSHFGRQWYPVDEALADALAEGSAPHATTRHWENCAVRRDDRKSIRVICPGGYTEKW